MSKRGEAPKSWGSVGNVSNAKSCFANARVKGKFINKQIQTTSTFPNFEKNLLVNLTEGAIFSWTIKC